MERHTIVAAQANLAIHLPMTEQIPMLLGDITGALPALGWIIAGAIVALGILIIGLRDVRRFSIRRVWAIGGVCFRESIRRRVLLIIPLAICGAVIVSELQKAIDEQDVVRQTAKFCLFAAGLVTVMSAIILGCTNLPREIETRVIYTIVTKPTTRLELIVGKIVGFARVAAVILLLMGLFTYGYLQLRAWNQERLIAGRLTDDPALSSAERNKLEHYQRSGLLSAREYVHPDLAEVMAPIDIGAISGAAGIPTGEQPVRAIFGDAQEEFLFSFTVDLPHWFSGDGLEANDSEGMGKNGVLIGVRLRWHRYGPETTAPATQPARGAATPAEPARFNVDLLDSTGFNMIGGDGIYDPRYPNAKDAHAGNLELPAASEWKDNKEFGEPVVMWAYAPASEMPVIFKQKKIYVHVFGTSHRVQYFAGPGSAFLMIPPAPVAEAYAPPVPANLPEDQLIRPDGGADGKPAPPLVRGRLGTLGGQQLIGLPVREARAPFAVIHFHSVPASAQSGGTVPLELSAATQHGGDLEDKPTASSTDLTLYARPSGAGAKLSGPIDLKIENKQTVFAELPEAAVGRGAFDLIVRCNAPGVELALNADTIAINRGEQPFAWNLAKSFFILWMMAVLVITLAVLSSTFVSWPIAVVLTLVLLMGHWAVTQVADTADKTLGRSIATDMGLTDPNKSEAVATSVNALSSSLAVVGAALPDIDRFPAIEGIDKGAAVSVDQLTDALGVLGGFALPAMALAYVILKKKEVAP